MTKNAAAKKKSGRTTAKKQAAPASGTGLVLPGLAGPTATYRDWTAAEMFAAKRPVAKKLPVCMDSDLSDEVIRLQALKTQTDERMFAFPNSTVLAQAQEDAAKALAAAEAAAAEVTVEFRFAAIPRVELDAMIGLPEHRPTEAHQEKHRAACKREGLKFKALEFNPETFPPALIAACCLHPELTLEQATEIWEQWGDGEAATVFDQAWSTQKLVSTKLPVA